MSSPDAVEARRQWAREQLLADPYMHTYSGSNNLLEAMHKKFGVAIDTTALGQIKKEVLAEKGLTSEEVMAHQRAQADTASMTKPKKAKKQDKAKAQASVPMAYLGKQLATVTKMLRQAMPDLTRFVMTADANGKTAVEYTMRHMSTISGKVKL